VIRPLLTLAAGVLGIAALGSAAELAPADRVPVGAVSRAAPVGATLVCPRTQGSPASTTIGVSTTTPGTGLVRATGVAGPGSVSTVLTAGARVAAVALTGDGPVVLTANGRLTPGLRAEELTSVARGSTRVVSDVACSPPGARQWFVGAGTLPGEDPVVTLTDPGPEVAVASITVLTPRGPVTPAAAQGIPVTVGSTLSLPLDRLAPGAAATAVEVTTVRGHLAAAVHDDRTQGLTVLGGDWLPAQTALTAHLVLGGIPGQILGVAPHRTLILANPGSTPATVSIHLTTDAGSTYVPEGLAGVTVPPDEVRAYPLDALLGDSPAAVEVIGAPLLGGVLVQTAQSGGGDLAYLGASPPLNGPAGVALDPVSATEEAVVVLSAPAGPGRADLSFAGPHGPLTREISVPAGQSLQISLARLGAGDTSAPLVVTRLAGSGPLYGTRVLAGVNGSGGPFLGALPLVGESAAVLVPAVTPLLP
jgi:hypothetical protein